MYTIVFKWKDDTMVVFDVYHTKRGKQRIIGNIFCRKEEDGSYKAHSLIGISSAPELSTSKIRLISYMRKQRKSVRCVNMQNISAM